MTKQINPIKDLGAEDLNVMMLGVEVESPSKLLLLNRHSCLFPASFKNSMLTAASISTRTKMGKLKKPQLRKLFFIEGDIVPVTCELHAPYPQRVGFRVFSLFHSFSNWKARFLIQYCSDLVDAKSVIDLLNRSGNVGVGRWSPQMNGPFGTYRVARLFNDEKEVAEVRDLCRNKTLAEVRNLCGV